MRSSTRTGASSIGLSEGELTRGDDRPNGRRRHPRARMPVGGAPSAARSRRGLSHRADGLPGRSNTARAPGLGDRVGPRTRTRPHVRLVRPRRRGRRGRDPRRRPGRADRRGRPVGSDRRADRRVPGPRRSVDPPEGHLARARAVSRAAPASDARRRRDGGARGGRRGRGRAARARLPAGRGTRRRRLPRSSPRGSVPPPRTGVVIEVHRALVPANGPFGADATFSLDNVRSHLTADTFRGRPVRRLSDGLLLAHLAAHWSSSFKVIGGAGGLVVLLDLLALVDRVDWARAADDLRGSTAAFSLWLLLAYLEARGLRALPPDVRALVRPPLGAADAVSIALLHALMDVRVANGRPYGGLVFTRRTFEIVWKTLLRPGPAALNLASLPWSLLPSRWTGRSV